MLKSGFLAGCKTQEEKDKRREYIISCAPYIAILKEILNKDLVQLEKEAMSDNRYDDQSWAYKQADYNGQKRTLTDILKLIELGD